MQNNFCPNCGKKIVEHGSFCMNCGFNISQVGQTVSYSESSNNYNNINYNANYIQQESYTNGMAIAGFVLSILSLCCCCSALFSVLGLVFSIFGYNNAKSHGNVGKGFSIAGIIMSSIALFFAVIIGMINILNM